MTNKIKIVQVTHDLALGGLQRVIVNICRTIDRNRFDLYVLCLRDTGCFKNEIADLGIPVTLIEQKKGTDYFSFFKVKSFLQQVQPDVIHTHNTQPFIDGTIASILTGKKIRIIHTDHARNFPDKLRYMLAERVCSWFSFKVVGVSEHTSQNLVKYEKISPKKIQTIPNGIDPKPLRIKINKEKKRNELGLSPDSPVLGVAVRLSEQKGISFLLKAMPAILSFCPKLILVIAGDGPLKEQLEKETIQLGIDKNVRFLGLRLDTIDLLKIFDIYVLPSLWEGLPMVILEAMGAGCPIIATDVGGLRQAIENKKHGLLIQPSDPKAIESAVISLLENSALKDSLAKGALDRFFEKYDAKVMTQQYESLYTLNRI